jgi:hypothetical protein
VGEHLGAGVEHEPHQLGPRAEVGGRISTPVFGLTPWIWRMVSAYSEAAPSGWSSRATPLTVAYRSPTAARTRHAPGLVRVQRAWLAGGDVTEVAPAGADVPADQNVASRSSQHSKMLGQPASWQRCAGLTLHHRVELGVRRPGFAEVRIQDGLVSMGTSAFARLNARIRRPRPRRSYGGLLTSWSDGAGHGDGVEHVREMALHVRHDLPDRHGAAEFVAEGGDPGPTMPHGMMTVPQDRSASQLSASRAW